MNTEKIGGLLRRLRQECQMTQKQIAAHLGVSDKTVSKWERGVSLR